MREPWQGRVGTDRCPRHDRRLIGAVDVWVDTPVAQGWRGAATVAGYAGKRGARASAYLSGWMSRSLTVASVGTRLAVDQLDLGCRRRGFNAQRAYLQCLRVEPAADGKRKGCNITPASTATSTHSQYCA